jgi:hypothetical protein
VCSDRLDITQLGCPRCGTGLTGRFQPCDFCGLDDAQRDILRVFLASRGNMKDLERHLGVSYPTARARFDDVLRALGMLAGAESPAPDVTSGLAGDDRARLDVLRAVASGELDVDSARTALEGEH